MIKAGTCSFPHCFLYYPLVSCTVILYKCNKSSSVSITCIDSVEGSGMFGGPGGACPVTTVCLGEKTAGTESLVGSSIP